MNTSTQANIANRNYRAINVGEEHDSITFAVVIQQLQDVGRALEDFKAEVDADSKGISEIAALCSLQPRVNTNPVHNEGHTSNYRENRMRRMRTEGRRKLRNKREYRRQASGSFPSDASTSQNRHGRRTSSPSSSASSSYVTVEETDEDTYDPNERRYCVCNQVSYGKMIACDNEDFEGAIGAYTRVNYSVLHLDCECEREWFHYSCVAVTSPPKGNWYCPQCQCNMGHKRDEN